MKLRSWLSTCSSATSISTADDVVSPPSQTTLNLLFSDTSSASPSSQDTGSSSLQSNLSLQTLPSVPSLQKLYPDQTLTLSLPSLSQHHLLASLKPRSRHVTALALHHNLLYAASGNEINVFDANSYALVDTFNGKDSSSGSVKSVTFCNGKVLTAHQDCKIRVWKLLETKRHKLVATLPTVTDYFRHLIFPKNHVKIRRHRKRLWIEHHDAVSGLAVANNLICSVSWDKCLKIWSVPDFRCVQSIKAHDDAINAVVVSIDGTIYTASADRRIKVWGRPPGERKYALIATLEKHKSAVNALAVNGDGTALFSGACDRSILVWEREDSANNMVVTGALRGHTKAILCLINVSDLLFSGSTDRTVRIWRRGSDGRFCCLTVTDVHEMPVRALTAVTEGGSPGGGAVKVFSGSFDGEIKVWKVFVSSLIS
ncbi:Myosin heavy chain kinase [Actinidia chinensis var. chinensis]|uniref:Myosin heavy chain kinase n=1 Tax=Actinidia chinensis var. chinensis TaxID=1590841 RepID=A0A2R6QR87_ACTCC|nr:Myosin heavy chain kinase [Actinidia chinensis var. chinensis]